MWPSNFQLISTLKQQKTTTTISLLHIMRSANTALCSSRLQIFLSAGLVRLALLLHRLCKQSSLMVSGGLRCTRSGKSPYWRWKFTGSAVFVVTHPVSLIQNSVSSIDRQRTNMTPQHQGLGEDGHDMVHLAANLIYHSFPLRRESKPPKCWNLLNLFPTAMQPWRWWL